jgi:hypothetical protein
MTTRWLTWLNPVRFLCEMGVHAKSAPASQPGEWWCARCRTVWKF